MARRLYLDEKSHMEWSRSNFIHYATILLALLYASIAVAIVASRLGFTIVYWNPSLFDAIASATISGFYAKSFMKRKSIDGIGYLVVGSVLATVYMIVYSLILLVHAIFEFTISIEWIRPEIPLGLISMIIGYEVLRRTTSVYSSR